MGSYGWQALYKAVALEANFRKMPHCIALAETLRAMHSALDAL
jgi:hypothetical protein